MVLKLLLLNNLNMYKRMNLLDGEGRNKIKCKCCGYKTMYIKYACECGTLIKYDNTALCSHFETKKHNNLITKNVQFITSISPTLPYDVKYEIISKLFEYYMIGNVSYSTIYDYWGGNFYRYKYTNDSGYCGYLSRKYFLNRGIIEKLITVRGLLKLSEYRLINKDFNRIFENLPIYKLILPSKVKNRIEQIFEVNKDDFDFSSGSMFSLDYWYYSGDSYDSDESSDVPDLPDELFY